MTTPLRAAIVGGGIGGLSTAIALRSIGLDVTVYEQASALGEVGAGIGVAPNGLRMYERLGLRPAIEAVAARYGDGSVYYRADGTQTGEMTTADSTGRYFTLGLHRADLVGVLADALPAEVVRTGHRLVGLEDRGDGVRLDFEHGETAEADLVIGADGIHSLVRQSVTEAEEPVNSHMIAYRGLVDVGRIPEWPHGIAQLWMGDGKHFLTYPVRSGRLMNYVGFVPSDELLKESWSAPGDRDRLFADFEGWDPRVQSLLAQVDTTFWWGLRDREPLARWSVGRVTLLGDAAHAMLPHLGQGANQAIEDAMALRVLLRGVGRDGIASALVEYEGLRRERTAAVQRNARQNGQRYDSGYEDLGQRDAEIRDSRTLRLWIYDHDAEAAAEAVVRAR